jgi:hypothetical protein
VDQASGQDYGYRDAGVDYPDQDQEQYHGSGTGTQDGDGEGGYSGASGEGGYSGYAGSPAATAQIGYDASSNSVWASGNTTGWPRGNIWVVGEITCDGTVVKQLENQCSSSTSCTLPTWSQLNPTPGSHWTITVTGQGERYSPVSETDAVQIPG